MRLCQIGEAHSLREICGGWMPRPKACSSGARQVGGTGSARLDSNANGQRPCPLFETVFQQLLGKCRAHAQRWPTSCGHKFRFKNHLRALADASVIYAVRVDVSTGRSSQRTKGASGLGLLLDPRCAT